MDEDKVLLEVKDEIGKIGTALEETRGDITKLQEAQSRSTDNVTEIVSGELKEQELRIIAELVPKIMEHQHITNLIKSSDETRAMIARMNEEDEKKGIKVDERKNAILDWMQNGGILEDRSTSGMIVSEETREYFARSEVIKEQRRLQEDTDWKGGVFVTPEMSAEVIKLANSENPLVPLTRNFNLTDTNSFTFPSRSAIGTAVRTGEGGTGTDTQSKYKEQTISVHNITYLSKATRDILADVALMESFITADAGEAIGLKMGTEIITGSAGTGLEGITINADISNVTAVETVANTISSLDFPAMYGALNTKYRANSTFLFNSTSLVDIMQFQSTTGAFIWQQTLADGPQSTVIGRPYVLCEALDDPADDTEPVFIGDFNKGYYTVNRSPIEVVRDPFTSKPNVEFLFIARNGGAVVLAEAIKKLDIVAT